MNQKAALTLSQEYCEPEHKTAEEVYGAFLPFLVLGEGEIPLRLQVKLHG